ncbi:SseB family protein [Arthrobacter agilis]|uniref:SseB family protein n=1 Tax=Arthrobacter agilis TaxID=37921 RepID=UPI002366D5B4|nr:SseB family protein [Arthrobacter agilis]WDF34429.1 SseB family protein [Arthrobacter agilis]
MTERQLPAHIAAALAGRPTRGPGGNTADSAGQPWAGRDLSGPENPLHAFDDDDGRADPRLTTAVAGLLAQPTDETLGDHSALDQAGRPGSGERGIVAALTTARVFIPIVAQLGVAGEARGAGTRSASSSELHSDKEADMALVTLDAPDGRKALPIFSSTLALQRWHPEARPVAAYASRAALAAVADGAELLVLDPGADLTVVVRRPALWALAQQLPWTPSYEDPALAALVEVAALGQEEILSVALRPAGGVLTRSADGSIAFGGGPGPELRMDVQLRPGLTAQGVRDAVGTLRATLLGRQDFVERVDSLDIKLIS